jgi:uncharacterized protein YbcI
VQQEYTTPDGGEVAVKTKGQAEAEIAEAVVRFEREFMGRGPVETRAFLIDDMVLIRLKGVMTPAEKHLAAAAEGERGRQLIKEVRSELLERGRPQLEAIVEDVLGARVVSLHTDVSTVTGERIILFTLETCPRLQASVSEGRG